MDSKFKYRFYGSDIRLQAQRNWLIIRNAVALTVWRTQTCQIQAWVFYCDRMIQKKLLLAEVWYREFPVLNHKTSAKTSITNQQLFFSGFLSPSRSYSFTCCIKGFLRSCNILVTKFKIFQLIKKIPNRRINRRTMKTCFFTLVSWLETFNIIWIDFRRS